jgi:membrane associated rhomboid family serine protease
MAVPPLPASVPPKSRIAPLTILACAACVVVFAGLNNESNASSWDALAKWGAYPADRIRAGAYWGFLTSVFVHREIWHVGFNVYWLYLLGSRMERAIGSWRWLAFFIAASFISSGAEFAFADTTGIGASGVVYAIFGFMWVTRRRFDSFKAVLDARTSALFFIWLAVCAIATMSKVWMVGNAAHIAGLLFGAGVGAWLLYQSRRVLIAVGMCMLFLTATVPLVWAPWSISWTSSQATRAFKKADYAAAIGWYERSMELGQDKSWCWQSIALSYYALGDMKHYQSTMQALHGLDEKAAREVDIETAREKK